MDILGTTIEDLDASQQVSTAGGSSQEAKMGLAFGIAIGAGALISGGLLGAAFAVGGVILAHQAL